MGAPETAGGHPSLGQPPLSEVWEKSVSAFAQIFSKQRKGGEGGQQQQPRDADFSATPAPSRGASQAARAVAMQASMWVTRSKVKASRKRLNGLWDATAATPTDGNSSSLQAASRPDPPSSSGQQPNPTAAGIDRLWGVIPRCNQPMEEHIEKQIFEWVCFKMLRLFVPTESAPSYAPAVEEEWSSVQGVERFFMGRAAFTSTVTAFFDSWCSSVGAGQQKSLLKTLRGDLADHSDFVFSEKRAALNWKAWEASGGNPNRDLCPYGIAKSPLSSPRANGGRLSLMGDLAASGRSGTPHRQQHRQLLQQLSFAQVKDEHSRASFIGALDEANTTVTEKIRKTMQRDEEAARRSAVHSRGGGARAATPDGGRAQQGRASSQHRRAEVQKMATESSMSSRASGAQHAQHQGGRAERQKRLSVALGAEEVSPGSPADDAPGSWCSSSDMSSPRSGAGGRRLSGRPAKGGSSRPCVGTTESSLDFLGTVLLREPLSAAALQQLEANARPTPAPDAEQQPLQAEGSGEAVEGCGGGGGGGGGAPGVRSSPSQAVTLGLLGAGGQWPRGSAQQVSCLLSSTGGELFADPLPGKRRGRQRQQPPPPVPATAGPSDDDRGSVSGFGSPTNGPGGQGGPGLDSLPSLGNPGCLRPSGMIGFAAAAKLKQKLVAGGKRRAQIRSQVVSMGVVDTPAGGNPPPQRRSQPGAVKRAKRRNGALRGIVGLLSVSPGQPSRSVDLGSRLRDRAKEEPKEALGGGGDGLSEAQLAMQREVMRTAFLSKKGGGAGGAKGGSAAEGCGGDPEACAAVGAVGRFVRAARSAVAPSGGVLPGLPENPAVKNASLLQDTNNTYVKKPLKCCGGAPFPLDGHTPGPDKAVSFCME